MPSTEIVVDRLVFPEGPRWHDGTWWFSDFLSRKVWRLGPAAERPERVVQLDDSPSGLGWLPDGRLVVVSMRDRLVLALEHGDLSVHADLSAHVGADCNDMVVDDAGRCYVGNFGYDARAGEEVRPTGLVVVEPDGTVATTPDELLFPNGMVITPDGATLLVAETWGGRITAFDRDADGVLSGRRTWAQLDDFHPDGMCLDAEGAVWVANPPRLEVLRINDGGAVVDRIGTTKPAISCMLGGRDGQTLLVCTSWFNNPAQPEGSTVGAVESTRVAVPRSGLP